MEANHLQVPDDSSTPHDAPLREKIFAVLSDATCELTNEEILAVLTLRRRKAAIDILEGRILKGHLGARLRPGLEQAATAATIEDFLVFERSEEDETGRSEVLGPLHLTQ